MMVQLSIVIHTSDGHEIPKTGVAIFNVVEEDGELKIKEFKEFVDPKQRSKLLTWGLNALAKGVPAA